MVRWVYQCSIFCSRQTSVVWHRLMEQQHIFLLYNARISCHCTSAWAGGSVSGRSL